MLFILEKGLWVVPGDIAVQNVTEIAAVSVVLHRISKKTSTTNT